MDVKEVTQGLIEFFSKALNIQEPITFKIEEEHPFGMAAVHKLKNGVEVDDDSKNYDQFEIIIYENKVMRQRFNEDYQLMILVTNVIHELVHVKHQDWDEDSVADEEARLHGLFMNYLAEKKKE